MGLRKPTRVYARARGHIFTGNSGNSGNGFTREGGCAPLASFCFYLGKDIMINRKWSENLSTELVEFNREKEPKYSRMDAEMDYQRNPLRACAMVELHTRRKAGWTPEDFGKGYQS